MNLNNLGNRLFHLERREEALAAMQEAIDIDRRLALASSDAVLPHLAGSLNNLGIILSGLRAPRRGAHRVTEAVHFYQDLAQARPDTFMPDLATATTSLGMRLCDLGRHQEALAASQRAVDICRVSCKPAPTPSCPISPLP